jgi:hypothetical protein
MEWPLNSEYRDRFFMPDLAPASGPLKTVFLLDSPSAEEVAPSEMRDRIPFRGRGSEFFWREAYRKASLQADWSEFPPRADLLKLCSILKFGIVHAVQFPMDPKTPLESKVGGAFESTPGVCLGFEKSAGEWDYKRVFRESDEPNYVRVALESFKSRLSELSARVTRFVVLGTDAKWFTDRALVWEGPEPEVIESLKQASALLL